MRTGNGKNHPPHIFSEIRPISTDFLRNIFAYYSRYFAIIGQLLDQHFGPLKLLPSLSPLLSVPKVVILPVITFF